MSQLGALGESGRYDELRELLESAGYSEAGICQRLHLERLAEFELEPSRRAPLAPPSTPLDVLIALFLAGDYVHLATLEALLGSGVTPLLEGMGLVARTDDGRCAATIALYPVDGFFIASNRWSNPDGSPFETPPDTVYPALVRNTRLFLDLMPDTPCDALLDLGSGTGIAAFRASRCGARHAWAADIAERSTQFAEFNRRLNALDDVTTVTSDLYERFEAQTFDRIVSHPPYMPVLSPKWVFMSGGEDGEQVTRRIVEGLPRHLRDGGLCFCLTMGSDRAGRPFEQRIRAWLGESESQFDIALIVRRTMEPEQYALRTGPFEPRSRTEVKVWRDLFARLEVEALVYGLILIARRNVAGEHFTVRREAADVFLRADWQWLLAWETAVVDGRLTPVVLGARLHASRHTEFDVRHQLTDEGWTPASYRLSTERPFSMNCHAEPWAAHLLAQCDGVRTGRELLYLLKEQGVIPAQASDAEFAQAVEPLISGGFLEVEGFSFGAR